MAPIGREKTTGPTSDLHTIFPAERGRGKAKWQSLKSSNPKTNLEKLTGRSDRGICYVRTTVQHTAGGKILPALKIDYFGKLWINGKLVKTIDDVHGNPNSPMLIPVTLKAVNNDV